MTREQKLEEALRAALLWTDEECDVSEWRVAAEAALSAPKVEAVKVNRDSHGSKGSVE